MHLSFFNFFITLLEAPNQNDEKTPFSKELCESILSCKGALIAESFSLWLKSPKNGAKKYPEHYSLKEKMLRIVIWRFEPK
jgi:hypothetical protein